MINKINNTKMNGNTYKSCSDFRGLASLRPQPRRDSRRPPVSGGGCASTVVADQNYRLGFEALPSKLSASNV